MNPSPIASSLVTRASRLIPLTCAALLCLTPQPTRAEDPPPARSGGVRVLVQGGSGAPDSEQPTPPPPTVTVSSTVARGRVDAPEASVSPSEPTPLRAVSLAEGEGTVEIDGRQEVVRPGSRLGEATVKSVSPDRLVLSRPSSSGKPHDATLVVVTFDAEGNAHTRLFWTRDPSAPAPSEAPRP